MSELEDHRRFLLNQQACMIQRIGTMVARRHTLFCRNELYAVDELFVEISFYRYLKNTSVEKITIIRKSSELEPYFSQIKLSIK